MRLFIIIKKRVDKFEKICYNKIAGHPVLVLDQPHKLNTSEGAVPSPANKQIKKYNTAKFK